MGILKDEDGLGILDEDDEAILDEVPLADWGVGLSGVIDSDLYSGTVYQ